MLILISACQNKTENVQDQGEAWKQAESMRAVQVIIEQNPEDETNPDKIARLYYEDQYPNFRNEKLTVSTSYNNNLLQVLLHETEVRDSLLDEVKLTVLFHRPMGKLQVAGVRHSWKCKGKEIFSAEPCTSE